jgi:hypothetical protein
MIRISTPYAIWKTLDNVAKQDLAAQIEYSLAGILGGVALRSDAGNHSPTRCHLHLLSSLNPLEEGWQVLKISQAFFQITSGVPTGEAANPE